MAEKQISGWIKAALDYGPIVAYFIAYSRLKEQVFLIGGTEYSGFLIVTAAFVPVMVLCTGLAWWLTGHLSKMQVVTVVLVVVFGGLSVWLQDERFFKMKPTLIYLIFAGALAFGLMRGKSYLGDLLGATLPLQPQGWMILTRRMALFFLALAVANEAVWRLMSTDAWVNFKTFGLTGALFAFFLAQGSLLKTYAAEPPKP